MMCLLLATTSAAVAKKAILVYKDKSHHIEIYERLLDGTHYLELENLKDHYVIICELNQHRRVIVLKDRFQNMGYLNSYYDVADTTNGLAKSLSGETLDPLNASESVFIAPRKLEMQLLQTAITRVATSPKYNLQLSRILFFVSSKSSGSK